MMQETNDPPTSTTTIPPIETEHEKIYYTTIFYPNYNQKSIKIALELQEKILEQPDIDAGYIDKTILLDFFPDKIQSADITEYSVVCEYKWTENDDGWSEEMSLLHRLPVR